MVTLALVGVAEVDQSAGSPVGRNRIRGLHDGIAGDRSERPRPSGVEVSEAEIRRQGFFAHELRNHLATAMLALEVIRRGDDRTNGRSVGTLERSLVALRDTVDRSMSEVRLTASLHHPERVRVAALVGEVEPAASMEAAHRGLRLDVECGDPGAVLNVDRQLLASALGNLLQNALKFTRPSGHVWLRTRSRSDSVAFEIEDECGGLPPCAIEALFRPFEQRGSDRSGLGLGLAISRQAVEADGGRISARDIPGRGCVFIVEMPLAPASQ